MTALAFGWPWLLLGLGAVPLLVLSYRRLGRARAARRAALAELGLVVPGPPTRGWRRHLPPAILLTALALLLVALARPEAVIPEPRREGTVLLVFDVSASMAATDVAPTRLQAAQAAARTFLDRQPSSVRVGVVAFGGTGLVTQEPTTDRARVRAAIGRLGPDGGTSLAGGLRTALGAIVGQPVLVDPRGQPGVEPQGPDLGYHSSAAIVLLSDGEDTGGPDPVELAELASSAGVRVYPVGIGRPEGTVLEIDGFRVATALDEPLLREIAARTDGRYFAAADERALAAVYDAVELEWTVRPAHVELTGLLAAAAAGLLLLGAALSLAWSGRVV